MPETWRDEVSDGHGNVVSSVSKVVPDDVLLRIRSSDRLRADYLTLRQWATDAATANTNWPTMSAAQKDATTRETIRRVGVFLDRFGDLLLLQNGDT